MTRRLLVVACCAAMTCALLASPATMQRASTGSIVLTVTSADGTPVTGLTEDDFVVQVDKSTEALTAFSAASLPLTMLALFDQSASVTDIRGRLSIDVAETLAAALRPGDRLRVGTVAGTVTIGAPISLVRRDIESALRALPKPVPFAASPLWDAVNDGVRVLSGDTGRRLLLLITDGRATGSQLSTEQAATTAAVAGVAVSTIDQGQTQQLLQDGTRVITVRSAPLLQWMTRTTGGVYYTDDPPVFRQQTPALLLSAGRAIRDQRATYQLTVPVADDQQFHPITVRVVRPGLVAHAPTVIRASKSTSRPLDQQSPRPASTAWHHDATRSRR